MSRPVLPPGSETCGCCDGVEPVTPREIVNRHGLDSIAYRIGDYAEFRASMLSGLSSSEWKALDALRTRDADDFTIALIDATACAADVLTFYQERLANESYLGTATERVSLQELARLIGYRLRPGVAAETALAFAIETPKDPPPGMAPDPGAFVTGVPPSAKLAPGLQVRSVPGPDERPQTFETVEAIEARPEWNAMRPWLAEPRVPARGATDGWLAGVQNNLKAGDALVFVDDAFFDAPATNTGWDFRILDTVAVDFANDRTHVGWRRPLEGVTSAAGAHLFALRTRAAIFGHNAPMWGSMSLEFRGNYPGAITFDGTLVGEWPGFDVSPVSGAIDLDAVYSEVVPGELAVVVSPATVGPLVNLTLDTVGPVFRFDETVIARPTVRLYRVASTAEVSRAEFAMSAKVTRLALAGPTLAERSGGAAVRETTVYVRPERLSLAAYPVSDAIGGDRLPLAAPAADLEPGHRLIVTGVSLERGTVRPQQGRRLVHEAAVVSAEPHALGCIVTIAPPLPVPLHRQTVVVHANVALAAHGETVTEILGSGDASKAFQRFELKRSPLTYRSAANERGAASELTVRVGEPAWVEKPTLFGAAPAERAYTISSDEQGRTWLVFGDGVRGARLPSGVNNVRATYRHGLGKPGNVRAQQLTQLATRPLGLKSVSNPAPAQGGTEAEGANEARRTMPLGTRTLGRAVSLLDYEDFALAFSGIAKAQARVLLLPAGPTIAITIAAEDGATMTSASPVWKNLWGALKANGDPHVNIVLLAYQPATFSIGLRISRDPAYELAPLLGAVEATLRAQYSFDRRALGQPVLQSELIAHVHSVAGVVAVDLDHLYPAEQTERSLQPRLLAARMRVSGGIPLPSGLLTLDGAPFDRLEELT